MPHGIDRSGVLAPRSKFYQGPFGRIFENLDPWSPRGIEEGAVPDHLLAIARDLMVEAPGKTPAEAMADRVALDGAFNSALPVGYTYFGQFVDHDITFDPASSLMRENDPEGLLNHRTPRFDLDSVFGRGRDDSPYLYNDADPDKFLLGNIPGTALHDLPRNSDGRALIGDARNDENAIVSQLHLAFLLAHNTLVDRARAQDHGERAFDVASKSLRWLYQFIVWNDFVGRIVLDDVRAAALERRVTPDGRTDWELGLKDVYKWRNQPFIPVEFSVAAYRFGHSLVRNEYQTNLPHRGFGNFVPIFDNTGAPDPDDLRGFRPVTAANAIQWDWFLQMTSSTGPFPQLSRKIDTKLANSLTALHTGAPAGSNLNILAFRNLLRGWRFGLPSGTAVARRLGVAAIDVPPENDALWFYILREAESVDPALGGHKLGRVGSIIVSATFAGLLKGDPKAWVNVEPNWTPDNDPLLTEADKADEGKWTVASIIRLSGLPVAAGDFPDAP